MQVKISLEEQVNLDKKFVESKLLGFSHIVKVEEKFIQFEYKNETFYLLLNFDGIPDICVLTDQIKSYPHFCLHKSLQIGDLNFYSICLYVRDEISFYNATYQEKCEFVLEQFKRLMNLNTYELEKEVVSEYKYHWNKKSTLLVYSNISPVDSIRGIHMFEYRRKKDKKPINNYVLSKKFPFNSSIYSYTQMNCLYLNVIDIKGILPPPFKMWDTKLLKELLFSLKRKRFDEKTCRLLACCYVRDKVFIFLRFPQLDNLEIGIKILFSSNIKGKLKEKISHIISITFIEVLNRNIETSIIRNGGNLIECKKVLVIGCGSLGSYIVRELPKIGVSNLTIVDGDNLEYCNLSRHILGEMFVGTNKATAMCELLSAEYGNMKFNAINEYVLNHNFSEIINDESDYDLIIITTGNEDLQYMYNNRLIKLKKYIPTIFCWLESYSIGSHALVMKNPSDGCYNCVLNSNFNYIVNHEKQIKYNGCGGVYSQYGINILLNTTSLIIDIINAWPSINSNVLYSYKTKSINNHIDGLQFTKRYYEDDYGINKVENLKIRECDCCD